MKILKFGGKSLDNGEGLQRVIQTIAQKYFNNEQIAVVVSARGNATDELVILLKKAQANIAYGVERTENTQLLNSFSIHSSEESKTISQNMEYLKNKNTSSL